MKRLFYLSIVLIGLSCGKTLAQGSESRGIVLMGFLVESEDRKNPVPFGNVIIPSEGVGKSANERGEFSIRVLPGDSLLITAVGYQTVYYRIPVEKEESYAVVIPMSPSVTMLAPVEVFPYPNEQVFKEAFLALDLEDERTRNLRRNLSAELVAKMAFERGMDAGSNYRNYMQLQQEYLHNRNFLPTLSLVNPFAWARFIESVKRGDYKKGKYKEYMKD
jgi:hypothetical protein